MRWSLLLLLMMHYLGLVAAGECLGGEVEVIETPGRGVQPQAVVDASGVLHLVYLRGDPGASDVFYARRKPGESTFGPSIRVNSEPGSAMSMGTVRGARIAIGRGGRVHIAWNGSTRATPPNPIAGSPLLYSRSNPTGDRFEPQRNLMTRTLGLDGGGSIAADPSGNVYVAWHGQAPGSTGEANRRVWISRSTDDGAAFAVEEAVSARSTGACGCCGLAMMVDVKGSVFMLYRAATNSVDRDMTLLTSNDRGHRFLEIRLDPWRLNACPMSTGSLVDGESDVLAAWETKGQVLFSRVDRQTGARSLPISPDGNPVSRKHPSLATNRRGDVLLVWAEGTGWQKGGSLAWQVFDKAGQPLGDRGKLEGVVPVWGSASVVARPDDGFTIIR